SYVSRKKSCVSSSITSRSRPSSEIVWTSTDDCFCHEHVRQSRSPSSPCAHRRSSSADIDSASTGGASVAVPASGSSGSGRLLIGEQHLLERVGAQAEPERLERDDLL